MSEQNDDVDQVINMEVFFNSEGITVEQYGLIPNVDGDYHKPLECLVKAIIHDFNEKHHEYGKLVFPSDGIDWFIVRYEPAELTWSAYTLKVAVEQIFNELCDKWICVPI